MDGKWRLRELKLNPHLLRSKLFFQRRCAEPGHVWVLRKHVLTVLTETTVSCLFLGMNSRHMEAAEGAGMSTDLCVFLGHQDAISAWAQEC